MAEVKKSKNARTGTSAQTFTCHCGGQIKMVTVMRKSKLKNVARCMSCKKEARKPRELQSL
jgi:transcription elongation factor Elf1